MYVKMQELNMLWNILFVFIKRDLWTPLRAIFDFAKNQIKNIFEPKKISADTAMPSRV